MAYTPHLTKEVTPKGACTGMCGLTQCEFDRNNIVKDAPRHTFLTQDGVCESGKKGESPMEESSDGYVRLYSELK